MNTTLIGSVDRIAIEYSIEAIHPTEHVVWVYGRVRFWFGGVPVGSWDDRETLNVVAADLERIAATNRPPIQGTEHLPADVAFSMIDDALFRDDERSDAVVQAEAVFFGRRQIIPEVDATSSWRGYRLREPCHDRILVRRIDRADEPTLELKLDPGEVDLLYREFVARIVRESTPADHA